MLKAPELAGAAEAGLDLVKDQKRVVGLTKCGELSEVVEGCEVRSYTLIGLEHDARDIFRPHAFLLQCFQEQVEACVFGPVTVREGNLDDGRVFIDDPVFLSGNSTGLLRTERAPVKAAFRANDADLFRPVFANSVRAGEFDGA